jgi:hypothetical protein
MSFALLGVLSTESQQLAVVILALATSKQTIPVKTGIFYLPKCELNRKV